MSKHKEALNKAFDGLDVKAKLEPKSTEEKDPPMPSQQPSVIEMASP